MEIPSLTLSKELDNLYHVYLFYIEDGWFAFGFSAYYMGILYPELKAFTVDCSQGCIPFLPVPDVYLLELSDCYDTLVSDAYVQVSVPPTAYGYRQGYDEWCMKLPTNINSLS